MAAAPGALGRACAAPMRAPTCAAALAWWALLPAAARAGMLWQGEREVMWDTVQLQATHTLKLSRPRRDAAEQNALFDTLRGTHAQLQRAAGGQGLDTATHFMQLDNFKNTQYSGRWAWGRRRR